MSIGEQIKAALKPYVKEVKKQLEDSGQSPSFSEKAAYLLLALHAYGLKPTITSIFRSKEEQQRLVDMYKAGIPGVYTPLQPGKSLHGNTTWYGSPASLAIDIDTANPSSAGRIAQALGIVWGGLSDPVHFAERGGHL